MPPPPSPPTNVSVTSVKLNLGAVKYPRCLSSYADKYLYGSITFNFGVTCDTKFVLWTSRQKQIYIQPPLPPKKYGGSILK